MLEDGAGSPAKGLTDREAVGDIQALSQIFEQRLSRLARGQRKLTTGARADVIARFGGLLRQLSTLMRINEKGDEAIPLDSVLSRLMQIITEALTADRSTLFLWDRESDELFSRVAQGELIGEIRIDSGRGIAGHVFGSGQSVIIPDAYADLRFNPDVDSHTGYTTRNILCAPVRNWDHKIIGVTEVLNKLEGDFDAEDLALLEALTSHAAAALETSHLYERVERARQDEAKLLDVTAALSSELKLDVLLDKIMSITTNVLDADRSTLFLYDAKRHELWSKVAGGLERNEIRIPANAGIAGSVFTSGETVNIPDAYADGRFNSEVDRATGYKTESILCMPVQTNEGKTIGVTQVLNKRGGPFGPRDEQRLLALGAQAAIALENARLFEDVLNARNYSESILKSLSNGVITLGSDFHVIKANEAALEILKMDAEDLLGRHVEAVFLEDNAWIVESVGKVEASGQSVVMMDADISLPTGELSSVNLTIDCLHDVKDEPIGFMLVMEDITSEKRVKTTMARYMDSGLAERLLESGELGGTTQVATVLFSDIHSFTGLSERLAAREVVSLLNEYFSDMVEVVFQHRGLLDKYIGDALMAVFGTPFPSPDDADRAVASAIEMVAALERLNARRALVGEPPIEVRIGVNTGEVLAGNIGSPKRMDYTVIGDSVNLAARLEGANKFYGTQVLISEYTYETLSSDIKVRELDLIRVKGRQQPVSVYEVLAARPERHAGRALELFAAGLERYRRRDWKGAVKELENALELCPVDRAAQVFIARSRHYQEVPPGEDWDGVWTLTEK